MLYGFYTGIKGFGGVLRFYMVRFVVFDNRVFHRVLMRVGFKARLGCLGEGVGLIAYGV